MNRFQSIVVGVVCAAGVVIHAEGGLTGKWQGTTESGRSVLLDLKVKGKQLTGTLTLAQQSANITEGTVEKKAFSFKATVDNRTITLTGRLVAEDIELTVPDVANPLTLKRVK
jgi:hypothetical protein